MEPPGRKSWQLLDFGLCHTSDLQNCIIFNIFGFFIVPLQYFIFQPSFWFYLTSSSPLSFLSLISQYISFLVLPFLTSTFPPSDPRFCFCLLMSCSPLSLLYLAYWSLRWTGLLWIYTSWWWRERYETDNRIPSKEYLPSPTCSTEGHNVNKRVERGI